MTIDLEYATAKGLLGSNNFELRPFGSGVGERAPGRAARMVSYWLVAWKSPAYHDRWWLAADCVGMEAVVRGSLMGGFRGRWSGVCARMTCPLSRDGFVLQVVYLR